MARTGTGRIVAVELGRVLDEFSRVDAEMERLAGERKRIAALAHRLLRILLAHVGARKAERLIAELGLAEVIGKLPGVPGRKPAAPVVRTRSRRTARPRVRAPGRKARQKTAPKAVNGSTASTPGTIAIGTPVRMLAGLYQDWTGIIRSIRVRGSIVIYAVGLNGPEREKARTEVSHGSLGKTWAVQRAAVATTEKPAAPAKARRRRKAGAVAAPVQAPEKTTATPAPAPGVLPKGTPIRMLRGRYQGWLGDLRWVEVRGARVTYVAVLTSPAGQNGRTKVGSGTLGKTWELVEKAASTDTTALETGLPAQAPSSAPTADSRPPGVLPKGTPQTEAPPPLLSR